MKATLLALLLLLGAASAFAQSIETPEPAAGVAPESEPAKPPVRRTYVSSRLSASVNALEAERRLAQAQHKRSQGMAPQAGESVRTSGGVVVNARYWRRQEKLRMEVEQAQRRMNHVQRPMLARQ